MKFHAKSKRCCRNIVHLGLLLHGIMAGSSNRLFAQTDTNSLKYRIAQSSAAGSKIDLENPIKTEWRYNARENRYEGFRMLGSLSYPTGETLSVTEYFQKQGKLEREQYFRDKSQSAYALGPKLGLGHSQ